MSSSSHNWLSLLTSEIDISPSFLKVLDEKLVKYAQSLAGINLHSGEYALLPPDSGFEVCYTKLDKFNIAVLEGYLVGPDAFGHPVTAIWYCPNLPNNAIDPSTELFENFELEIYWSEFPIDGFRAYTKQTVPLVEISAELSFQIEWKTFTWPDVHLVLQMQNDYSEDQLSEILDAIDQTILYWNEQSDNEGKVHYRGNLIPLTDKQVKIHIDFGSASKDIIVLLLQNLDSMTKFNPLELVTFHS
jgi:hypothetical protein